MKRLRANPVGTTALVALLLFTTTTTASDKCRSGCKGAAQIFKYAPDTTYKYNFEGNVEVALSSAEGQQTTTKIKATVLLTQQAQCTQVLRLQNVQVIGNDGKKYSHIADIEKSIVINNHDGHVEDVICTETGDTQNSLNIKRAVASLFQASVKSQHETDVFGVCPTETNVHKEGSNWVVQKRRSLNKCAHRESIKQDFMATAFNLESEIKSSPLLHGEYVAEQRIKNDILDHALVTETYLYVPFSVGKNGAKATVSTKIQFVSSSKEPVTTAATQPKSIIFENPHLVNADVSNVDAISAALKKTKQTIDNTVGEKSAKEFVNLIKILRVSNANDLLAVYGQIKAGAGFQDKTGTEKVFLDALFRAGTGDTIDASIRLLKQLTPAQQKLVYLGLSFVKHATTTSLDSASTLLDIPDLPREAYLGIGTLASRYCREHPCKNVDAFNKLVQKLGAKLGDGKASNRNKENEIIATLKAIGNIGHISDAFVAKVIGIAKDKKTANRLRVAALETLAEDACKDKIRDAALEILKDTQQDSEVRIKAYLVMARCPNGKIANGLKAILDAEPTNQVGGFIVSHLRNLGASANPDRQEAKQHLANIHTTKRFPIDPRKYSFNGELSYTIDTLGLASAAEANVIYSQKSFLPRSTNLNLTAELFGHTFNFLEIGTRQENFDKVLEHYIGPLGVLREYADLKPEELSSEAESEVRKLRVLVNDRLQKSRAKRDVSKGDLDGIGKQVQIKGNQLNNDMDLDLSVKLFGSELLFVSRTEDFQNVDAKTLINRFFDHLDKGVAKAKNFEHSFQSNVLFLDAEISYPTSMGFPLRLAVEGSTSVQLKAAGQLDLKSILNQAQDGGNFKLSLIPSANIEVTGSMTLDAQVIESGLKVTSSLYTATGGDLTVNLFNENRGLDVKFALPVEKQKLISASHEIVFHNRELGKPETITPIKFGQNKDFSICLDQLVPYVGVAFCADINTPPVRGKGVVLPFPLSGNAKLAVGIEREDISLFHYRREIHQDVNKAGVEVTLETLDANNAKKLGLQVEAFLTPDTFFKATFHSAIKKATLEGRIVNSANEKAASLLFQHDNNDYLAKVGVTVSGTPAKSIYKPLIVYSTPGAGGQKPPVTVEGTITVEKSGENVKYTFEDVKVIAPNEKSYALKGTLGKESGAYFTDLTLSDGAQYGSLKSKLDIQPKALLVNAEWQTSFNPQYNANVKYEFKREKGHYNSNLQVTHGADLASKDNRLSVSNELKFDFTSSHEDFLIKTDNKLTYPAAGFKATLDYEQKPKSVEYEVELHYGKIKIGSELEAKWSQKTPGDYNIEFGLNGFENKLEAKAKRDVNGHKSKVENYLNVNGNKIDVSGSVAHLVKPDNINVGVDLVVQVPCSPEPIKVVQGLVYNPNEMNTHLKIASGASTYVDAALKGTKGGNVDGHVKLTFKDVLNANGQIKAIDGAGNSNIVVDFQKLGRKVKGESTFKIANPTYNVQATLWTDFEKDNNKKIVLATTNTIKHNHVNSKSTLDINGKKFDSNFQFASEGVPHDVKTNCEGELTLPNDFYVAGKYKRELKIENGVANGNLFASFEQRSNKNAPGNKISWKTGVQNSKFREGIIDVTGNFALENSEGKTLNGDWNLKRLLSNEGKHVVDYHGKLTGSILTHPLEGKHNSEYLNRVGTYAASGKYGPSASFNVNGKYDFEGQGKPISGEVEAVVHTPFADMEKVKWAGKGSVARPSDNNGYLELKGAGDFSVDSAGASKIKMKGEGEVKLRPTNGKIKGSLDVQNMDPISLAFGYGLSDKQGVKKFETDLEINYAKDKHIKTDLALTRPKENEWKAELKLDTPQAKNTNIQLHAKRSDDNKTFNGEAILFNNNQRFVLTQELVLSEIAPSIDLQLTFPTGKVDRVYVKLNRGGPQHLGGELKLIFHEKDFVLESTLDANVPNVDEFTIKATVNSPALKLDTIVFEAQNKAAKTGKRILISVTSAGTNLLSGSTSYKAREENGKYIVEGSGTFKVKEESKAGNFKLVRHTLHADRDGEAGFEVSFNAGLGSKAVDAELKLTTKQLRILNSYCEEKKQCAHIEIDSKTNTADVSEFNHELEVAIDLRKLGWSHEFGLKGVTNRKHFVLDHTVDVYFQNKENKYQYSLYVHPNEAGASLTTPKRVISIEGHASLNAPPGKGQTRSAQAELAVYLDKKNQPQQKTALSASWTIQGTHDQGGLQSEVKFTNPALGKDLSVTYTSKHDIPNKHAEFSFIVDVFARANQKFVVKCESTFKKLSDSAFLIASKLDAKSQGLNIHLTATEDISADAQKKEFAYDWKLNYGVGSSKYDNAILVKGSLQHAQFLVKALNKELINANARLQLDKESQVADTTLHFIGVQPLASHVELKNYNTFRFWVNRQGNENDKFEVSSGLIPGQIADFRADVIKGGAKNNLVHATVKLDESNFLKSDYGLSSDNIQKHFLQPTKQELNKFIREIETLAQHVGKDISTQAQTIVDLAKKNAPNFKPLRDYYQAELEKLREELISDETLKQITDFVKKTFGAVAHAIIEIFSRLSEIAEKVIGIWQTQFAKIVEIVNNDIVPRLADIGKAILGASADVFQKLVDIAFVYLAQLSEIIDAHQAELKQLATSVGAVGQEVGRFVLKMYEQVKTVAIKEWDQLYQEIKALPIAEEIKAQYEQWSGGLPISEDFIMSFKEGANTIHDSVPSEELKTLVKRISDYIEKKLRRQQVDDMTALREILQAATQAANKLLVSLGSPKDWSFSFSERTIPLSVDFVYNLPRLVAMKFSPISYIITGDYPHWSEVFNNLSLNPRDWIPPFKRHAYIALGQHIFTFSGRHITFPGKCSYLYVRDAANGNFSVAGTFDSSSQLASITVADKTGTITIQRGGKVLFNGAATDLPIRKSQLQAYRLYEVINVVSKAGITVACGPELTVCGLHVSGFYHGQLRGLLGVADHEPYDDWTLPNGKIVISDSEFGNAYKVGSGCADVQAVEHTVSHSNPECTKLFSEHSSFRWCFPFVNPQPFKVACNHGHGDDAAQTARAAAMAYVASCNARFIPIHVPERFVECKNSEKPFAVGDKFSVKTPGNAADVVLVVDQVKHNEPLFKEFLQPLVTQMNADFSAKGITDVEYHLIGYGGEYQKYPSHFTSDGQMTFKATFPHVKFTDEPKTIPWNIGHRGIEDFLRMISDVVHDLRLVLSCDMEDLQSAAYKEATKYPFRAHAVKALVAVTGIPCEQGRFLFLQRLRASLYSNKEVGHVLVTPFQKPLLKDAKQSKNVIGFNSEHVFTVSDAKKKPEGTPELHKDLDYNDFCVDFTLKNHGSVFVANNFLEAKGGAKKQYIQTAAHNIVNQLTEVEQGLDCECKVVSPYSARNVCHAVYTKDKGGKTAHKV